MKRLGRFRGGRLGSRRFDAAAFLTLYAALLFLVPANLIVKPLGAAGTPANLLGIVALIWWITTRMVPGIGIASGRQPIRIALGVFALAVVASYLASMVRPIATPELNAADRGLLLLMSWLGPALVAADGLRNRLDLDRLLKRVCAFASIVAVMGMVEFFARIEIRTIYTIPGLVPNHPLYSVAGTGIFARVAATATHPIEFGVVLAVVLPVAVHYALAAPRATVRRWWFIVASIGIAIPMALSRSAILSLAAAAIVLLAGWSWRLRVRALAVLAGFMFVMQGAIPGLLGTIRSLFANIGNDDSIKGRTDDYSIVGQFISERPFFGRGFQTFIPSRYVTLDNQLLGVIIELGFFGLLAFLFFFTTAFFTTRGARRRSRDVFTRDLAQALAAAVLAAFVGFFTFDALGYTMISGTLFLLAGCAGALWRVAGAEQLSDPPALNLVGSAQERA